jgi:hypothetical protein
MSYALPFASQRPNGRTSWSCDQDTYADGAQWSECKAPDPASVHRQRHLTYPQLLPGELQLEQCLCVCALLFRLAMPVLSLAVYSCVCVCVCVCLLPCLTFAFGRQTLGGFWVHGMGYDGERSNALPLVRFTCPCAVRIAH